MSDRGQELLGKALMVTTFAFLLLRQLLGAIAMVANPQRPPFWGLTLVSQGLSLVFVAVVVLMTIRRLPPRSTAAGIEPRLTAIAGTFVLMLLVFLPAGATSLPMRLAATILIVIGTALSIYCLHFLGRSFSIVASARALVTGGPYGIVRHPLYVAEGITTVGIIMLHWSAGAVALGLLQIALQFRRMQNEEQVLRAAFPEYAGYADRVPMFIPGQRKAGAAQR